MLTPLIMSALRTERLLNLLTLLLNSRRPVALREIRELDEFGAYRTDDPKSGERAFERDKAALLELGVPLRWVAPEHEDDDEGTGGYTVDKARYFLPQLHLSATEAALLSIAGAAAAALSGFSGKAAVIRALAKLGFDDVQQAAHTPAALAHTPLSEGADVSQVGGHLEVFHDAIAHRRRVALTYASDSVGGPSHKPCVGRQVDSYGLYYRQGNWYLVGYCHLRQAIRTFNVARVRQARALRAPGAFEVPPDFNLKQQVQRRPWEYGSGETTPVTIRLAHRLRPAIDEIFGSRITLSEVGDEGRNDAAGVLVHLEAASPEALIQAVLPYGQAAEILRPAALRARIGAIYDGLAQRYAACEAQLPRQQAAP